MEIIIGKQGNQKISITEPTVSRRHCKVTSNGDGSYTLENLSETSYTKVDGKQVIKTTVTPCSILQLGPVFRATLGDLIGNGLSAEKNDLKSAGKSAYISKNERPSPVKNEIPVYNISHLRRVWEDFDQTNLDMAEKQRKVNLARTLFGIFTMCAMPTIFFFGAAGYALTGVGILGNLYSFVGMRNAETPLERRQRQEAFDDVWVCPNPQCGHSLNAKNYRRLVNDFRSCPYCKCKYVER